MTKTIGTQYNSKPTDCNTCENARNNFTPGGWVPCADCRPEDYAKHVQSA